jgi:hypothetical protein
MTEQKVLKPYDFIEDFVTGRQTPLIGSEANRQEVEKFLVEKKGYAREEITVDQDLILTVGGEPYRSQIDLLIRVEGRPLMAVKCAAGSLDSRQREIVAVCRIAEARTIPLAVVSDGKKARIMDAVTGERISDRLEDLAARAEAVSLLDRGSEKPLEGEKIEREKRIFRTYDMEDINVQRKLRKPD